ncbi:hypothetical protein, partial [Brevundimonas sp.]|uniref:hypothetical protein n=1 Tax=Brevundimonas sp. TaxID=1871086 RepID=UPI0028A0D511
GDPVEDACQPLVQSLEHSLPRVAQVKRLHTTTAPGDDHVGGGFSPGSFSFAGYRPCGLLEPEWAVLKQRGAR